MRRTARTAWTAMKISWPATTNSTPTKSTATRGLRRTSVRHRIAGNRVNMARPRRVSAFRNMIDGLYVHEHMTTTLARCKAVQGEAETLIATAIRGHNAARKHLAAVVPDEYIAEQVLGLARRGNFRMDQTILPLEELNAQRAERGE